MATINDALYSKWREYCSKCSREFLEHSHCYDQCKVFHCLRLARSGGFGADVAPRLLLRTRGHFLAALQLTAQLIDTIPSFYVATRNCREFKFYAFLASTRNWPQLNSIIKTRWHEHRKPIFKQYFILTDFQTDK